MMIASFALLVCLGLFTRVSEVSTCHAQCDYDHVTAMADCSNRNLSCIPDNYPVALVMNLSHNAISVLEPGDFNGTFASLVELYLDNNNISDVTSLLQSTAMDALEVLSLQFNVISSIEESCRLSSLNKLYVDSNVLTRFSVPRCGSLDYISANFNLITSSFFRYHLGDSLPSFISMQFNQLHFFHLVFFGGRGPTNLVLLLDNNNMNDLHIRVLHSTFNVDRLSLSNNSIRNIYVTTIPTRLNMAGNGLSQLQNGFRFHRRDNKLMEELDIDNNSFHSLIQPEWAEGLKILRASDNLLANLSSATLQGFVNLTELHLANNQLLFISATALGELTVLQSLYLDGNALTSLWGGVFLNQAELVELSITNNRLSVLHPDYFLGLDSLERLYLAGNRLVHADTEMLRLLPGLTLMDLSENKLEVFDIRNCNLGNLVNLLLAHNSIQNISLILGQCGNLEVLDLSFNQVQVVPGDSLTGGNRALSRLELEGNPLQCDCRLSGLRDWLRNNPPSVLPRCHGPPQNSGAAVTDLGTRDFICDPPRAMTNVNHLNLAVGQTATLSCTAIGVPIPVLTWLDPNGTVIPDEWQGRYIISSDVTLRIISVEVSDQGTYTCLAQNILGEADRAVVSLTVRPTAENPQTSLAAVVLPTMLVTIAIGIVVVVFVVCLRRRLKKRRRASSGVPTGDPGHLAGPAVIFRRGEAPNPDAVYVNEVKAQERSTAVPGSGSSEEYQDTTQTGEPTQVYQDLTLKDMGDDYEPIAPGSFQ